MSRAFTEPDVQAANDSGCIFYDDPATLRDEQIDPLLRDAVRRINGSGWVWTAESCQGHPDADDAWVSNTRPMLRLVCRVERRGDLMDALCRALVIENDAGENLGRVLSVVVWPHERRNGWFEALVYINAAIKGDRDAGCRCYDHFAEIVSPDG